MKANVMKMPKLASCPSVCDHAQNPRRLFTNQFKRSARCGALQVELDSVAGKGSYTMSMRPSHPLIELQLCTVAVGRCVSAPRMSGR